VRREPDPNDRRRLRLALTDSGLAASAHVERVLTEELAAQLAQSTPQELADYDAIIFGTPTRFGNMSGQMRTFLDQTGGLWASGALYGKLASVFSSTGTGGGQEHTISSTWTTLAHHGMVIVPIGYATQELFDVSQVHGGTPYGATTIAGGDGSRQPSNEELSIARYQGEYVAGLAVKLNG